MNLYRISQDENNGYDTYDEAVVCAADERKAKHVHPSGDTFWINDQCVNMYNESDSNLDWTHPGNVTVTLLATDAERDWAGVVCASFNAG